MSASEQPGRRASDTTRGEGPISRIPAEHIPDINIRRRGVTVRDAAECRGIVQKLTTKRPRKRKPVVDPEQYQAYRDDPHFLFTLQDEYVTTATTIREEFPIAIRQSLIPRRIRRSITRKRREKVQNTALKLALKNSVEKVVKDEQRLTDPLTGAWSRKAIDTYLGHVLRSQRSKTGLLFLDLDHFKDINDTLGHDVGDRVLVQFVDILQAMTRQTDMVGRYGGEEFVIVLPDMLSAKALARKAEEIRKKVAATIQVRQADQAGQVTVSIGVTMVNPSDLEADTVYKRGDLAVYAAKGIGRNRSMALVGTTPDGHPVFDDLSVFTAHKYVGIETGVDAQGRTTREYRRTPYFAGAELSMLYGVNLDTMSPNEKFDFFHDLVTSAITPSSEYFIALHWHVIAKQQGLSQDQLERLIHEAIRAQREKVVGKPSETFRVESEIFNEALINLADHVTPETAQVHKELVQSMVDNNLYQKSANEDNLLFFDRQIIMSLQTNIENNIVRNEDNHRIIGVRNQDAAQVYLTPSTRKLLRRIADITYTSGWEGAGYKSFNSPFFQTLDLLTDLKDYMRSRGN